MFTPTQLLTYNLAEVRRRSLIVWKAIPDDQLSYRPDSQALSLGESKDVGGLL